MKYNYEFLCEKQFQKFVYALLINEYPNLQSLPVGQPDGGRDGFAFESDEKKAEFTVFQVKYSVNPSAKDERDAIAEIIKSEGPKVKKLIAKGASNYVLVTNISGTAHLEVGAIDKINKLLTQSFSIPTKVIWRDDLDTRLDNNQDVKGSYPQICNIVDLLQSFLKSSEPQASIATARTIKGFISTQFSKNETVKFKQVDLSKDLFDLFIDVPLGLKNEDIFNSKHRGPLSEAKLEGPLEGYFVSKFIEKNRSEIVTSKAASFFLKMPSNCDHARIVLEGAPGQGKSTVTQFVCQMQRVRFLFPHRYKQISESSEEFDVFDTRIPIQVDLRDFAAWLNGEHPFNKDNPSDVPSSGSRTLESFLAMLISWDSSGAELTEDELISFFENTAILIALDGFDEVADIETRKKLVQEVHIASNRIGTHAKSLQIIVTSRPAAFANSPGFSKKDWSHLELRNLDTEDIFAYKDKWMSAQSLEPDEIESISTTLASKLDQSHIRDLARSPMQLAILLHLIHAQGPALPDKRTALYNKYIELFFDRESEKSKVVRDYRGLLMSIHGYLGWVLQTESELGVGNGSITKQKFKDLVESYLTNENYTENGLAEKLLTGIEERVVALVARVEGTLEFEVQPLREYFTAFYLYDSAPHSALGKEKKGTRPDRFDALARNNYWTNVTRFYCGFYGKGELASLVDGIVNLSVGSLHYVSGPRNLAITLLSDWVFAQSPRDTKKIVEFITREAAFRRLVPEISSARSSELVRLPDRAGRKELLERCKQLLNSEKGPSNRVLNAIILSNSTTIEKRQHALDWISSRSDVEKLDWNNLDLQSRGVLTRSDVSQLAKGDIKAETEALIAAGFHEEIFTNRKIRQCFLSFLADGNSDFFYEISGERSLLKISVCLLMNILSPHIYARIVDIKNENRGENIDVESSAFNVFLRSYYLGGVDASDISKLRLSEVSEGESTVVTLARKLLLLLDLPFQQWLRDPTIWEKFTNYGLELDFSSKNFAGIAVAASTTFSLDPGVLFEEGGWLATPDLMRRLQLASTKGDDPEWWIEHQPELGSDSQKELFLIMLFSVSDIPLVEQLLEYIKGMLSTITDSVFQNVYYGLMPKTRSSQLDSRALDDLFANFDMSQVSSQRIAALTLHGMASGQVRLDCSVKVFKDIQVHDAFLRQVLVHHELFREISAEIDWDFLANLSRQQVHDVTYLHGLHYRSNSSEEMPLVLATNILANSHLHSTWMISIAEKRISIDVAANTIPLHTISKEFEWFEY